MQNWNRMKCSFRTNLVINIMRKLHGFWKGWIAKPRIAAGLGKTGCCVGAVNWDTSLYKQRTPVFLCRCNKPWLSPPGHERNLCSLQEQQLKWCLVLQMKRWCWVFFTRISHSSEVLRFQAAKQKLCGDCPFFWAFYWDTKTYLQSVSTILSFQRKITSFFSGSCHFYLKDLIWALRFVTS